MANNPATESTCAQGRAECHNPSRVVMKPPLRPQPALSVPFRGVKASLFYRGFWLKASESEEMVNSCLFGFNSQESISFSKPFLCTPLLYTLCVPSYVHHCYTPYGTPLGTPPREAYPTYIPTQGGIYTPKAPESFIFTVIHRYKAPESLYSPLIPVKGSREPLFRDPFHCWALP